MSWRWAASVMVMPSCWCRLRSLARFGVGGGLSDELVDLFGDVMFQAAGDLPLVLCFGLASGHILFGAWVGAHPVGGASAITRCWLGGCCPG